MMKKIKLYTTAQCSDCAIVKSFLDKQGIMYENKDIMEPEIMEELQAKYPDEMHLPIVVINEQLVHWASITELKGLILQ